MTKAFLLRFLIIAFTFLAAVPSTFATHNRAGEITYVFIGLNKVQATIATWTQNSSVGADRDSLPIDWGDGSPIELISRYNGPPGGCCGVPHGVYIGNDIKWNLYTAVHTYPGAPPPPNNFYIVSMSDPNRNAGIVNIANSVNVQFYIEDTIFFPVNIQDIGYDRSPICLNPPIDFGYVGDTFWHNPAAYDPDGDSLDFQMYVPLQAQGINVPGYKEPTDVPPGPSPIDVDSLDIHTGMYTWATPQVTDIYNVAFLIREYRRGQLIGTIDRDMQIIVLTDTTDPPSVNIPIDTCVRAGDPLRVTVTGTDRNLSQTVTLTGYGGPLAGDPTIFPDSLSPATFTNNSGNPVIQGNPAIGIFDWNTVCLDIRAQPYQIVFKASNQVPKVDLKTCNIQVIAPPPLNLTANLVNRRQVKLDWHNPYKCDSIHTFRGFSIWKKVGSNPFIPAYCETGLAGRGYTEIASGVFDTSYVDQNVTEGQQLCYRILANFSEESPNGLYQYNAVVSVPSNEDCIYLPYDVPVITDVSVLQTDTVTGQMFVAWIKPKVGGTNLDTTLSPPPYRFDLYRGTGENLANPAVIHSSTSPNYHDLADTIYTDSGLNTRDSAYTYKVLFYSNNDTVGATNNASSVYLSLYPSDTKMRMIWTYNVPWTEDSFQIYRKDFSTGNVFHYVGTSPVPSYVDTGLINDSTYCYYVDAFGHYTDSFIHRPLTDSSEVKCGIPVDTIPPCPPVVKVTNDCGNLTAATDSSFRFINYLTWVNSDTTCGYTTIKYRIYYTPDTGGSYQLIDSVAGISNTSYNDSIHYNLAGCYIVTAVDKRGNESYKTNQVCIEDCPNYDLPNTFTPNGDGSNDLFTPFHPYRFVTRVEITIFTRWGEKVFYTTNPEINWDGKDQKTGKALSDGVYLYSGYYYEKTLYGEVRKNLPHKNGGGFIHLIRGK